MKAILFAAALVSTPAFAAGLDLGDLNLESQRRGRPVNGCHEGDTRYFTNDGYCRNGMERSTYRQCISGRYVVIREFCHGGGR